VKLLGGPPPSEAMMSATVRNTQTTAIDKLEQERQEKKPLPKPNMEATTASEAYPLPNLIENFDTTMTLLKVEPWRSAVKKDEAITMTHRFPASRVVRIVQENKKNPQMIKALQYLLILLQVHSALKKPRGLNDNASLPKELNRLVPAAPTVAITDSIKRKLTSSGQGSVLPTQSLILLRTTILALTLHIDNYTTDIRDIVKDLDMDVPTIQKYYRDLGCKPHKPTESEFAKYNVKTKAQASALKIFELKVPLEFPKARVKGLSSRKRY
jgi:A49-like RNA polymerase I associated factor